MSMPETKQLETETLQIRLAARHGDVDICFL